MKIPKGWRKLKVGTVLRKGDKLFIDVLDKWKTTSCVGTSIGQFSTVGLGGQPYTYIRKIKK